MLDYLEKLVSFYPVTDDTAAVGKLLDYAGDFFASKGFTVTQLEHSGTRSLVASVRDTKTPLLMLQGHIDVVPGLNQPFRCNGDRISGRGVYDMLFGTAAFMQLVDDIDPVAQDIDLAIMLVGDEEHGGLNGARLLLEEDGFQPKLCLLPDAGEGFGSLSVAAKGTFHPYVRINGKSHHGSRPWEGDGAAGKLIRFISELEKEFDTSDQSNSTMTVATLAAGNAGNQGPATAEVRLDIRYKDKQDLTRIEKEFYRLLKKYDGEVISLNIGNDFQLDTMNSGVRLFISLYEQALGKPVVFTKAHGSSDARFFAEHGVPVIMLRPDGGGAHGDDEWLSKQSFEQFYDLLRRFVTSAKEGFVVK